MAAELTLFFPPPVVDRNKWLRPALMMSNSVEWYTPPHIRDAVVETLGKIDLDPCADPGLTFPAAKHYTPVENGLVQSWVGRVYMNPPYGLTIRRWTQKLRHELDNGWCREAVALLPARPDARWFQDLEPSYLCFISGRLKFSGYTGAAPFSSVAAYFGDRPERFFDAFRPIGLLYANAALRT